MKIDLRPGDCIAEMRAMAAEGILVDSIVTDPPYHLTSFVKRFGGENAAPAQFGTDGAFARASKGFMGKTWDGGDVAFRVETWRAAFDVLKPGGHLVAFGGTRTYHRMVCAIEDAGFEIRDQLAWAYGTGFPKSHNVGNGWGTALKPAWEPIVLARKPLSGKTVAANVLKWGTGALNIDGCRVPTGEQITNHSRGSESAVSKGKYGNSAAQETHQTHGQTLGRWPANLVHDGSEKVLAGFPQSVSGPARQSTGSRARQSDFHMTDGGCGFGDRGSAARFFYCAKAGAEDRNDSKHPTVKPVALMRWLVRMVTPPGGTVLDPFAGTGTTGAAAMREGFNAVLIEAEAEYQADIRRRIANLSGLDGPLYAR